MCHQAEEEGSDHLPCSDRKHAWKRDALLPPGPGPGPGPGPTERCGFILPALGLQASHIQRLTFN